MSEIFYKTVRNDDTFRRVYYHPKTGIQISVVVLHRHDGPLRVCFPHEHSGWAFHCHSLERAEYYIQRQYTWFGRLKNAIQFTLANKRLAHL